jgi:hypothetical protein
MAILAIVSFVVSVIGWFSYVPVAKSTKFRRTLWPTRLLLYGSLLLAILAYVVPNPDPHTNVMFVSATCISFALFTLVFYAMLRLPVARGRPEVGKAIPAFEVLGEDGKPISSDQFIGKGPTLFIFFRGFW